jgi:TonB family protein
MRTFRPIAFVVIASFLVFGVAASRTSVLAQAASVSNVDWEAFRPDGEEFTIVMPKDPKTESSTEQYHKMELNTNLYLSAAEHGPVFAIVSLSGIKSNPAMYTEFERLNSYVDAFKNWFPAKVRGKGAIAKLTLVGDKTLNGNQGREYRMVIGDLSGTAQVYATRRRFYAVVVLNTKKDDALSEQFLSSFYLPEKVAKPAVSAAVAETPGAPVVVEGARVTKREPGAEGQPAEGTTPGTGAGTSSADGGTKPAEGTNQQPGQKAPINGGVLNGKAISLPQPAFPPIALQAKASGTVVVQVLVDEQGNVIGAHAVSGHPLLQAAAVAAARQAKFQPTFLLGEPAKVTGVLTYTFSPP